MKSHPSTHFWKFKDERKSQIVSEVKWYCESNHAHCTIDYFWNRQMLWIITLINYFANKYHSINKNCGHNFSRVQFNIFNMYKKVVLQLYKYYCYSSFNFKRFIQLNRHSEFTCYLWEQCFEIQKLVFQVVTLHNSDSLSKLFFVIFKGKSLLYNFLRWLLILVYLWM